MVPPPHPPPPIQCCTAGLKVCGHSETTQHCQGGRGGGTLSQGSSKHLFLGKCLNNFVADCSSRPGGVTSGNILIWLGTCRRMNSLDMSRGIFVLSNVDKVYQFHWKLSKQRAGEGDCWVKK